MFESMPDTRHSACRTEYARLPDRRRILFFKQIHPCFHLTNMIKHDLCGEFGIALFDCLKYALVRLYDLSGKIPSRFEFMFGVSQHVVHKIKHNP